MIGLLLSFAVVTLPSSAPATNCAAVDGPRIHASDLTLAAPGLAFPDPGAEVGFAPEPGAKRVFHTAEILAIARRVGLDPFDVPAAICFERRTREIRDAEWIEALRPWLPQSATVNVIDKGKQLAPEGKLIVPRPGSLGGSVDRAFPLRGYIVYDTGRRFGVWARVAVRMEREIGVASESIPAGASVRPEQVRWERRTGGIELAEFVSAIEALDGQMATRVIAAGQPLRTRDFTETPLVKAGSLVRVDVRNGATHLELEARADASGRKGDLVKLRNLSSGRSFGARVTGPASASIVFPEAKTSK